MTATPRSGRSRARRQRIELPRTLIERFQAVADPRDVPGSTVLYGLITQAARYAREGKFDLVPPVSRTPPTTDDQSHIDIPMSRGESEECQRALRDAGSSLRAAAAVLMQAYIDADGSPVEMEWPRRARAVAA